MEAGQFKKGVSWIPPREKGGPKMKISRFLYLLLLTVFLLCRTTFAVTLEEFQDPDVVDLVRNKPDPTAYPNASIIYLLDESKVRVAPDGTSETQIRQVYTITQERGRSYGNVSIGYNSRYETLSLDYAVTITPAGDVVPASPEVIKDVTPYAEFPLYSDYKVKSFALPAVTLGSTIAYKVTKRANKPLIDGDFADRFYFQGTEPVWKSLYQIRVPKKMNLRYLLLNPPRTFKIEYSRAEAGGGIVEHTWSSMQIPQLIGEASMPVWDDIVPSVLASTVDSWKDMIRWWARLKKGKTRPDAAIKGQVAALIKGLSSQEEKIRRIFNFVQQEIRYVAVHLGNAGWEPHDAATIFRNRYGDCKDKSTLLISMLMELEINADYCLLGTNNVGQLVKDLPFPLQFDHCIIALADKGKYTFLDAAGENIRYGYLPGMDQDRTALAFNGERAEFVKTPIATPEENTLRQKRSMQIQPDGGATVEVETIYAGDPESYQRTYYSSMSPVQISEDFQNMAGSALPGGRLLSYEISDPLDLSVPFRVKSSYEGKDFAILAGDLMIFSVPGLRYTAVAVGKKERRFPIRFWTTPRHCRSWEITVPEGFRVKYMPRDFDIGTKFGSYRAVFRQEDDKILIEDEEILSVSFVPPEDYPAYQKFLQERARRTREYIVLEQVAPKTDK